MQFVDRGSFVAPSFVICSTFLSGIYVQLIGVAHCYWTEGSGKHRKEYSGNETYLDGKTYFVGGPSGQFEIQPRSYSYVFECPLPEGLPASLEGSYGYIRYVARVTIDRPKWPNQQYAAPFTVIKPLNLNLDSSTRAWT